MTFTATLLATALLAAAEPPQAEPPPTPRTAAEITEDETQPPPASKSDQLLWRRGKESTRLIHAVRAAAGKLSQRVRYTGLDKKLEALVKTGDPAAVQVKDRLVATWTANANVYNEQWPVDPTRGCLYPTNHFEAAIQDTSPAAESRIAPHRKKLVECLDLSDRSRANMAKANEAFLAAIVEAEKLVAARAPGAAGSAKDQPSQPVPAAEAKK